MKFESQQSGPSWPLGPRQPLHWLGAYAEFESWQSLSKELLRRMYNEESYCCSGDNLTINLRVASMLLQSWIIQG